MKERKDHRLLSRLELYTMENGSAPLGMDLEFRFGLMVQDIKENGLITKHVGKENFGILMETYVNYI
jgi:hypothetical protein